MSITSRLMLAMSACVAIVCCITLFAEDSEDTSVAKVATAEIVSCDDASVVLGEGRLEERASDEGVKLVDVRIRLGPSDLTTGKHAVHIHETAACSPCGAAKGHFDPGPNSNTSPDGNHPFHMGDLVNIVLDDEGKGELSATTSRITLSDGPLSLFDEDGSSFIIHVNEDTYCAGGEEAGCAGGARAACGIIKRKE